MIKFTPEQTAQLSAKLDPKVVNPPKQFGPKGDYIEGWHAIAEANRIFGFDGWSYDIVDCRVVAEAPRKIGREKKDGFGVTYVARVKVEAGGITREDVGSGHGYDLDLGLAHESAVKEAITDALKRALRTFGNPFGLALYDKTRENVGLDEPKDTRPSEPLKLALHAVSMAASSADLQSWWKAQKDGLKAILSDDECTIVIDAVKSRAAEFKAGEAQQAENPFTE